MDSLENLLGSLSESDMENIKAMAKDLFAGGENASDLAGEGLNLAALGSLLSSSEDDRSRLIKALKPMLSAERQKRANNALRFLRLASALPALQQSGLLNGFLEDLDE